MTMILPGDISTLEPLQQILKTIHDDRRMAALATIARRQQAGAPLDDDTRWPLVVDLAHEVQAAASRRDVTSVRNVLFRMLDATSSAVEDPGEYKPIPGIDGVEVSLKVLTAREWRRLSSAEQRAVSRQYAASKKLLEEPTSEDLHLAVEETAEATIAVRRSMVVAILHGLRVNSDDVQVDDRAAEMLDRSGMLYAVYTACAAWQELPWGKGERSGSQPRVT